MQRRVNWAARALGFVWIGLFTFVIAPPHGSLAWGVQIAGYSVAAAGLVGWSLADLDNAAARYPAWLRPVALGAMVAGAGFASSAGHGGTALVVFAFVATMMAGAEPAWAAAIAVTAVGVLAIEVSGLIFSASYGVTDRVPWRSWSAAWWSAATASVTGSRRSRPRCCLPSASRLEAEQRRADLLDERARIAREIHDVLAHSLGALGIQIQAARAVMTREGDIDRADELLGVAQQMAGEGLAETRRAIHALRADTLPLDEELAGVTETYAQRYRVEVELRHQRRPGAAAARRHDRAAARSRRRRWSTPPSTRRGSRVTVRLDYSGRRWSGSPSATIWPGYPTDAPRRALAPSTRGYGLTGMRERLRLLNGTLEAGQRDGQWIVTAEVPRSGRSSRAARPPEQPGQPQQPARSSTVAS